MILVKLDSSSTDLLGETSSDGTEESEETLRDSEEEGDREQEDREEDIFNVLEPRYQRYPFPDQEEEGAAGMALPNAEALGRMTPEEVLAQLLAERNAAEAAPAGAGIRNLFRLDPPSLDDHHNYKTFERALYHWTDNTE